VVAGSRVTCFFSRRGATSVTVPATVTSPDLAGPTDCGKPHASRSFSSGTIWGRSRGCDSGPFRCSRIDFPPAKCRRGLRCAWAGPTLSSTGRRFASSFGSSVVSPPQRGVRPTHARLGRLRDRLRDTPTPHARTAARRDEPMRTSQRVAVTCGETRANGKRFKSPLLYQPLAGS